MSEYEIATDDKIREIEDYLETLKDKDGVLIIDNESDHLLNAALKIIKGLKY